MSLRLPAPLAIALGLFGLASVLLASLGEWGAAGFTVSPRLAAFAVAACLLSAVALASDPAWSFSGGLALSMFSGHWGELGIPLPLDRLLLVLGVAGVVARVPIKSPARWHIRPVNWAVAAAALFAIVSAVLSGTLGDPQSRFALLDRFGLVPFVAFVLAPFVFDTPRRRTILLWTLAACGVYLGVTALAEATHARWLTWPGYILDAHVGDQANRARGPFVEVGAFGLALWGCAVAALVHAASSARPWLRAAALVVTALCVLGVLFTLTRAIWVGAVVSAVVTLVFAKELRRFILPAAVACALLVVGALATVPDLSREASQRRQENSSVWDRKNSNAAAVRMLEARPLVGFGWDSFQAESAPYYRIVFDYPLSSVGQVHNVFLSNAAELGLIGTSLWLVALVVAVGAPLLRRPPPGLRLWRIGLLAIAAMWFVAANLAPLAGVFPNLMLWTWAGVLWVRSPAARAQPRQVA